MPHRIQVTLSLLSFNMKTLTYFRDYYDSKQADQGFITFDLQADLAPLFNWNVKVTQQVPLANKQSNLLLDLIPISHIGKPTIKSNIRPHLQHLRSCSCTSAQSTQPQQLPTTQRWLFLMIISAFGFHLTWLLSYIPV